jgi:hypothetical protein
MSRQALVLDANILIRAVLGQQVFKLLNQYCSSTSFYAPDEAFTDAEKYLPPIFEARGLDFFGSGIATWTTNTVEMYLIGDEYKG